MASRIRVAILDDHQGIVDGYRYRLGQTPTIEIVATAAYGEALEPLLAEHPADVLILDVRVPTSPTNPNAYPILHLIPKLLQRYPNLAVLVISVDGERALIQAVMKAGASGYILKDDQGSIEELGTILLSLVKGGIHFSRQAYEQWGQPQGDAELSTLTPRQIEALSLCAAYPDETTANLAKRLGVTNSGMRNLLSTAYIRLSVRSRSAAIAKAWQSGLIAPLHDGRRTKDRSLPS
ncbi:MAG: response regulator [Ardenticatenaceae bacterium]